MISSPTNDFDSMSSESLSSSVTVNSSFVGNEVFIDGESSSNRSILKDVSFDAVDRSQSIARKSFVFVSSVSGSIGTLLGTFGLHFRNVGTVGKFCSGHVMSTEWHSVRVTALSVVVISSSHHSSSFEPVPRSVNLSSVTSIGIAVVGSTTSSSISSREERSECSVGFNAQSVIVSFGGSMSPARSTVGLISYVSNHTGTLGPLHTRVEGFRGFNCQKRSFGFDRCSRLPERVDDSSHHLFDLGLSHLLESGGLLSLPSGVGSVDLFGNSLQV